jgi:GDSL-like Lipase/Acylhydrolase family
MRKRFLVGFVLLLAVAALLPSIREAFQRRAEMIPWQRVQEFAARGDSRKAVVVVGDSLVESAAFTPALCGLPVINAGLAGARAKYALWVLDEMSRIHFSPSVLVISVGINDAIAADQRPFAETYPDVVRRARALTNKVFVVTLAPIAAKGNIADMVDRSRLPDIGQTIRQTAQNHSVPIIDVSTLDTHGRPWTEDGVHFNQDGYVRWIGAIESAVSQDCP